MNMKNLLFLCSALFFFTTTAIAQEQVSFKGFAYNEMRDVAKGKKIASGTVKLFDAAGKEMVAESAFTETASFSISIKPETTYMLKVYDAAGKLLKEGPFGISKDYYAKNEALDKGRWVPFEEGRSEYGLAIFTATSKLPPTKYEGSSSTNSRSVGNMQLPDLMSSLTELRAFSW